MIRRLKKKKKKKIPGEMSVGEKNASTRVDIGINPAETSQIRIRVRSRTRVPPPVVGCIECLNWVAAPDPLFSLVSYRAESPLFLGRSRVQRAEERKSYFYPSSIYSIISKHCCNGGGRGAPLNFRSILKHCRILAWLQALSLFQCSILLLPSSLHRRDRSVNSFSLRVP